MRGEGRCTDDGFAAVDSRIRCRHECAQQRVRDLVLAVAGDLPDGLLGRWGYDSPAGGAEMFARFGLPATIG
jgi:hypothetical protein